MTTEGIIHRPGTGETLRILLGEHHSDGALGVVEMAFAPGDTGPPLHVHPTHAEAFYVLAGELTLQVGTEVVTGGAGTWACAPKNIPHTLANLGTHQGRVLCCSRPAASSAASNEWWPTVRTAKPSPNRPRRNVRPDW